MSESQTGKILSEETKNKIREKRKLQEFSEETKEKLKGFITVVDIEGDIYRIPLEKYNSQNEVGNDREYVTNNSLDGRKRKQMKKDNEQAQDLAHTRR